jgi:hypothetical protein
MSQIKRSFMISRVDEDQHMVYGIAATDQLATDGFIVTKEAMKAAWDDYMKFANIREMHKDIAAGVVKEYSFEDDGVHIGVYVADESTWAKIKAGVLKAFSIGAQSLQKIGNVITEIILYEISLVDRPADPGAVVTMFRGYNTRSANNRGRSPKEKAMTGLTRAGLAASKPMVPPQPAASVPERTQRDDGLEMAAGGIDPLKQNEQDAVSALMQAFHQLEDLAEQIAGHIDDGQTTDGVLAQVQNAHRCLGRALTEHVKAATAYDPGEDSANETDAAVAGTENADETECAPASSERAAKPQAGRAPISRNGNGGLAAQVAALTASVQTLVRNGGLVRTPRSAGYQPAAQPGASVAPQPVVRTVSKQDDNVQVQRAEDDDGYPAQGTLAWKGLDEDTRVRVALERNTKKAKAGDPSVVRIIGPNGLGRN